MFEHLQTSRMAALDHCIVEADWYIDEEQVAYVSGTVNRSSRCRGEARLDTPLQPTSGGKIEIQ